MTAHCAQRRNTLVAILAIGCMGLLTHHPRPAWGAPAADQAHFALVIGVNTSVDAELSPLRYADDDAARYFDLFRALGYQTYVLTRPDPDTRRLHPQASAEALAPRESELARVVSRLVEDVRRSRERGIATTLYFIYAGHGNVRHGTGYITLEDARLDSTRLRQTVFDAIDADRTHLIIDACHSYLLAYGRGPGGEQRRVENFSRLTEAFPADRFGLLLSTSTARESHEWEGFQAGVFSHEVRSGLYGAADADNDGRISYREIAAFIVRANAAIANERFRPRIFARPLAEDGTLVDLRGALVHYVEIDAHHHGRYMLEDRQGVRLADFHSGPQQTVRLIRPLSSDVLYLHRLDAQQAYTLPRQSEPITIANLSPTPSSLTRRGATHESFQLLFALSFDHNYVEVFQFPEHPALAGQATVYPRPAWQRYLGWGAVSLGSLALAGATTFLVLAHTQTPGESHAAIVDYNHRVDTYNTAAIALYAAGGAALAGGLWALLWPRRQPLTTAPANSHAAAFSVSLLGPGVLLSSEF